MIRNLRLPNLELGLDLCCVDLDLHVGLVYY